MLSCKQITELVTDYLEGRMPLSRRMSFRLHVGMCAPCRAYLRQMQTTVEVLGRMPEEPIPDAMQQELVSCFRSWRG